MFFVASAWFLFPDELVSVFCFASNRGLLLSNRSGEVLLLSIPTVIPVWRRGQPRPVELERKWLHNIGFTRLVLIDSLSYPSQLRAFRRPGQPPHGRGIAHPDAKQVQMPPADSFRSSMATGCRLAAEGDPRIGPAEDSLPLEDGVRGVPRSKRRGRSPPICSMPNGQFTDSRQQHVVAGKSYLLSPRMATGRVGHFFCRKPMIAHSSTIPRRPEVGDVWRDRGGPDILSHQSVRRKRE